MRLWTAIGAWAGLMAVSLALYALGVSLESKPHAGSSALVPLAIGFGSLATLIFAGDLVYLARRDLRRRRALRAPAREYGALDYEPEFLAASERYNAAQVEITAAAVRAGETFAANNELTSQQQADECARTSQQLCDTLERLLPTMSESGEVAGQCLRGHLRTARPANAAERDELRELRQTTRGARASTGGYLRALKSTKRTTVRLRKRNLSRSLNESANRLQGHLKQTIRIVRVTARGFRAAEWQMTRRLTWGSALARLPHAQRNSPERPAPEPPSTVDE